MKINSGLRWGVKRRGCGQNATIRVKTDIWFAIFIMDRKQKIYNWMWCIINIYLTFNELTVKLSICQYSHYVHHNLNSFIMIIWIFHFNSRHFNFHGAEKLYPICINGGIDFAIQYTPLHLVFQAKKNVRLNFSTFSAI